MGVIVGISEKNPKRYQNLVLWAWLKLIFTPGDPRPSLFLLTAQKRRALGSRLDSLLMRDNSCIMCDSLCCWFNVVLRAFSVFKMAAVREDGPFYIIDSLDLPIWLSTYMAKNYLKNIWLACLACMFWSMPCMPRLARTSASLARRLCIPPVYKVGECKIFTKKEGVKEKFSALQAVSIFTHKGGGRGGLDQTVNHIHVSWRCT